MDTKEPTGFDALALLTFLTHVEKSHIASTLLPTDTIDVIALRCRSIDISININVLYPNRPRILNELGMMFLRGTERHQQDSKRAFEYFKQACGLPNPPSVALYNLGRRYELGDGCEKDTNKARELYLKSADKEPKSMWALAIDDDSPMDNKTQRLQWLIKYYNSDGKNEKDIRDCGTFLIKRID